MSSFDDDLVHDAVMNALASSNSNNNDNNNNNDQDFDNDNNNDNANTVNNDSQNIGNDNESGLDDENNMNTIDYSDIVVPDNNDVEYDRGTTNNIGYFLCEKPSTSTLTKGYKGLHLLLQFTNNNTHQLVEYQVSIRILQTRPHSHNDDMRNIQRAWLQIAHNNASNNELGRYVEPAQLEYTPSDFTETKAIQLDLHSPNSNLVSISRMFPKSSGFMYWCISSITTSKTNEVYKYIGIMEFGIYTIIYPKHFSLEKVMLIDLSNKLTQNATILTHALYDLQILQDMQQDKIAARKTMEKKQPTPKTSNNNNDNNTDNNATVNDNNNTKNNDESDSDHSNTKPDNTNNTENKIKRRRRRREEIDDYASPIKGDYKSPRKLNKNNDIYPSNYLYPSSLFGYDWRIVYKIIETIFHYFSISYNNDTYNNSIDWTTISNKLQPFICISPNECKAIWKNVAYTCNEYGYSNQLKLNIDNDNKVDSDIDIELLQSEAKLVPRAFHSIKSLDLYPNSDIPFNSSDDFNNFNSDLQLLQAVYLWKKEKISQAQSNNTADLNNMDNNSNSIISSKPNAPRYFPHDSSVDDWNRISAIFSHLTKQNRSINFLRNRFKFLLKPAIHTEFAQLHSDNTDSNIPTTIRDLVLSILEIDKNQQFLDLNKQPPNYQSNVKPRKRQQIKVNTNKIQPVKSEQRIKPEPLESNNPNNNSTNTATTASADTKPRNKPGPKKGWKKAKLEQEQLQQQQAKSRSRSTKSTIKQEKTTEVNPEESNINNATENHNDDINVSSTNMADSETEDELPLAEIIPTVKQEPITTE